MTQKIFKLRLFYKVEIQSSERANREEAERSVGKALRSGFEPEERTDKRMNELLLGSQK